MSCLAGIGLDRLTERADAKQDSLAGWRRFVARWGTVLVFGLVSLACVACLVRDGYLGEALLRCAFNLDAVKPELAHRIEWQVLGRECVKLAVLGPVAATLVWTYVYVAQWRRAAGWLLAGVVFVDLFLNSTVLLPSGSSDMLRPDPEYEERFHHSVGEPRFLEHDVLTQFWLYGVRDEDAFRLVRSTRGGSWAIADRIFAAQQNSSLFTADFLDVIGIYLDEKVPWEAKERLLRMMNCDTVVRFPDVFAYLKDRTLGEPEFRPVREPLPRAYVVGGMEVQPEHKNVLGYLVHAEFDPLALAVTDEGSVGNATFYDLEKGRVEHTVEWVEHGLHRLALEVHCERPGILVLSEAYYPGWRATVNGQDAPIYKVNGTFRGVRVDAGDNAVLMVYTPTMLRVGCIASLATAVACVAGLCVWAHSSPWQKSHFE